MRGGLFDDDFDPIDFAFLAGYLETQMEGEKERQEDEEPLSFEDSLKTGDEEFGDDMGAKDYDLTSTHKVSWIT